MRNFASVVFVAISLTVLAMASPCDAKSALRPQSIWYEPKIGGCLVIDKVSEPLSGSDECVQISGSRSKTGPVTGYACERQRSMGFFAAIAESDNDIKPDFFVGTFSQDRLDLNYCTRISNDLPPDFNCKNSVTFKSVGSCPP